MTLLLKRIHLNVTKREEIIFSSGRGHKPWFPDFEVILFSLFGLIVLFCNISDRIEKSEEQLAHNFLDP